MWELRLRPAHRTRALKSTIALFRLTIKAPVADNAGLGPAVFGGVDFIEGLAIALAWSGGMERCPSG